MTKKFARSGRCLRAAGLALAAAPACLALQYANPGGSPDNVGAWIGASGIWSSFEFPSGSFRSWYRPTQGIIMEEVRYESWECTDTPGTSRVEFTHVEVLMNGTATTDTKCATWRLSADNTFADTFYHTCGEEPSTDTIDDSWYTNFRLNSTIVPAPSNWTCNGSPVTLDTSALGPKYEGAGSVTRETGYIGNPLPAFEEINANGIPDYSNANGKPFMDGMYYADIAGLSSVFAIQDKLLSSEITAFSINETTFVRLSVSKDTGYEQSGTAEVYKSSDVHTQLMLNGTLGNSTTNCLLSDLTDPYTLRVSYSTSNADQCPQSADEAVVPLTRMLFFPPQVDIESAPEAENAALVFASALEMDGEKQAPPIDNITTTASFIMNKPNAQGWVTFDLDVANATELSGSGGFTMAHIHAGNSTTNGPPVLDLVPTLEHWPTPIAMAGPHPVLDPSLNTTDSQFTGAFSAADFYGPLANATMDSFIQQVIESEENYYVNVHTVNYPAGAIRAQLKFVGEPPSPTPEPPSPTPEPPEPPAPSPSSAFAASTLAAALAVVLI